MCSARLFAMLSSVFVEGFCTALTLLTRRHDNLIRFGPLLLPLISTGSLEVFFVNHSRFQSSWTIGTGSSITSSLVSGIVASNSPSRCLFGRDLLWPIPTLARAWFYFGQFLLWPIPTLASPTLANLTMFSSTLASSALANFGPSRK